MGEHTHTASCYSYCNKPEHQHNERCQANNCTITPHLHGSWCATLTCGK